MLSEYATIKFVPAICEYKSSNSGLTSPLIYSFFSLSSLSSLEVSIVLFGSLSGSKPIEIHLFQLSEISLSIKEGKKPLFLVRSENSFSIEFKFGISKFKTLLKNQQPTMGCILLTF